MPATYTASAYFLGKYRPVYVTGDTPTQAMARLAERIADAPDALRDRLQSVWDMTTRNGTLTFAWVGQADHQMHSMMMTAISRAATGEA